MKTAKWRSIRLLLEQVRVRLFPWPFVLLGLWRRLEVLPAKKTSSSRLFPAPYPLPPWRRQQVLPWVNAPAVIRSRRLTF